MFAGQHHLENLVVIVDYNRIQALGFSKDICDLGDFATKAAAFGWGVQTVDGHDFQSLENTFKASPLQPGKPSFVVCNTIKGKGVSFLENTVKSHYWHVTKEDLEAGCRELEV